MEFDKNICLTHNKEFEYFCLEDSILICEECYSAHSSQKHSINDKSKSIKNISSNIPKLTENFRNILFNLEQTKIENNCDDYYLDLYKMNNAKFKVYFSSIAHKNI